MANAIPAIPPAPSLEITKEKTQNSRKKLKNSRKKLKVSANPFGRVAENRSNF